MKLFIPAVFGLCAVFATVHSATADIYAQLFPLTGEVRLLNKTNTPIDFTYYSITSPSGALSPLLANWKSITNNYDRPGGATPGNGLIDPTGDWVKLAGTSVELTEGALGIPGGALPAYRAVSLGTIWNSQLAPYPDLIFDFQTDTSTIPVTVEFALDGDYSGDHVVDAADYIIWRKYSGSTTAYFADGNLNGVVDDNDKLIWQQNFGQTLSLPLFGGGSDSGQLAAAGGVPEPSSAVAAFLLASMFGIFLRPRRK